MFCLFRFVLFCFASATHDPFLLASLSSLYLSISLSNFNNIYHYHLLLLLLLVLLLLLFLDVCLLFMYVYYIKRAHTQTHSSLCLYNTIDVFNLARSHWNYKQERGFLLSCLVCNYVIYLFGLFQVL